ncbi:MAG: OmpA family protein [Acidobacteria bacterium]|nr:OmpA family protein [Acidobacteriota bacterium]
MRYEQQIERPLVLEAPLTPAIGGQSGEALPSQVVRVLGDVTFAPGSAALLPPSRARLDRFAEWLSSSYPDGDYRLEIQGHTDAHGSDAGNERLGLGRAEVVRRYLCELLVLPLDRALVVSAGARSPVDDDGTVAGRSRNRRVVVLVLR